jgi:transcriptional regulator with XRE-family HTH domain
MKPIGKQIRQRREAEGITQVQLAARASVSKNIVSMIESHKMHNPTLDSLRAIANALDCDLVVKLRPRKKARPEPVQGGMDEFGAFLTAGRQQPERSLDPRDAEVQAKMNEIVAKIEALPWPLVPDAEQRRNTLEALAEQGDWIAAETYLDALQDHIAGRSYIQVWADPKLLAYDTKVVITPKADIPRKA